MATNPQAVAIVLVQATRATSTWWTRERRNEQRLKMRQSWAALTPKSATSGSKTELADM
jgi:hypothetical protein